MFTQGSSSLLYWLCFKARSHISPSLQSDSYSENAKTAVRCLDTGMDGELEAICITSTSYIIWPNVYGERKHTTHRINAVDRSKAESNANAATQPGAVVPAAVVC